MYYVTESVCPDFDTFLYKLDGDDDSLMMFGANLPEGYRWVTLEGWLEKDLDGSSKYASLEELLEAQVLSPEKTAILLLTEI